jgi:membrane associated rhomboid family serine protease
MRFDLPYESPRRRSPFSLTPWVRGIIAANAVVYLLTITVFTGPWVVEFGAFNPALVENRWWTFATYMFLHGSFFHLLFNMLLLFFFGPAVEEHMGNFSFAAYYFTCGVGGGILSLALASVSPAGYIMGASGAVLGVALAFAMNWPNAPVYVFPLPVPIKVKWLVAFFAIVDLIAAGALATDGTAHLAHLGGLLFGFIYLKSEDHVVRRAQAASRAHARALPTRQPRTREPVKTASITRSNRADDDMQARYDAVDRVLDKISQSGLSSLTPEERQVLDEASQDLRQH